MAPIASLSSLQTLVLSRTKVLNLAPITSLAGLRSLDLSGTHISDLAPIASLSALQSLVASNTQISDLSPTASLSALQNLDVSRTQIFDLAPLALLAGLRSLDLSGAPVSDLAPLTSLSALQALAVSGANVSDLSPLASLLALKSLNVARTQIYDLAPLASLSALQNLVVSRTKVSDLAPLASLSGLRFLDVYGTPISDLAPIASLFALQTLYAARTRISGLSPLASLSALQTLYLHDTPVSDLAPLASLHALESLSLSNTQISDLSPLTPFIERDLPVRWSSESWKGPGINIENCPLTSPPPEIVKQGNAAILNYFEERKKAGTDHLYEAKMLILGEGGVGKTSLLRRLYQPTQPLPTEVETTKGIDIHRHHFPLPNGRTFRLNVWDFGGQEIYHATHQFFLTRRSLYVLLDDTRKDNKSVSDKEFKDWLEMIDIFSAHSPVLIFQNEKGGRSKAIDLPGIQARFDNVKQLYRGNLEYPAAPQELATAIEQLAATLPHIGEQLPARWIKVREDIESRTSTAPYISQHEYFDIYRRHMEFDLAKALHLSRYLHDLGVFLHFQDDPLLRRTVILQNQWATEAVFRILDDETVKAKHGRFATADCERLWRESAYADMHLELLSLMKRFELCYELQDVQPVTWLAPRLLPPTKPAELAAWNTPQDLVLRYRYEFLPKGTISRLTVRLHRFVRRPKMTWVTGVLFEHETTQLLVEVLPTGNEIELRARGPENKALLSVVAADLDALNDSIEGLRDKVDKRIPCNCKQCAPHFFAQRELIRRKENM